VSALEEATAYINKDKTAAAEAYLRISKDKDSVADILAMLNDPAIVFTMAPAEHHGVRQLHGEDRHDQGQARVVEGHVLPQRPRPRGQLMRDAAQGDRLALPDLAAIRAAHARIAPHVHRTPVLSCHALDAEVGARLWFKCENFQKVGAFKARGATNAVFSLTDDEARRGVLTHSSGNHGAGACLRGAAARHRCMGGDAREFSAGEEGERAPLWRDDPLLRAERPGARGVVEGSARRDRRDGDPSVRR
jgi:hypothetical protein